MRRPTWVDLGVGAGVGGFSGLLGVGGGILLVPYLTSIRKVPQKQAQATSLVLVSMGAASSTVIYALHANVAWIPALIILIGGLVGAAIGTQVMQRLHDRRLRVGFGILLLVVAVRMVIPSGPAPESLSELPALTIATVSLYLIGGLATGVLSSMFGVGGGIILIPILVTILGFAQQLANGTSLAVMAAIAIFGAARLSRSGLTDWRAGLSLGAAAVIGAIGGSFLALALPADVIRVVFAVLLIVMGIHVIRDGLRMPTDPPAPTVTLTQ